MDACLLIESSSYTLRRAFGCFEIDAGVALRFDSISISVLHFDFSSATLLDRTSQVSWSVTELGTLD